MDIGSLAIANGDWPGEWQADMSTLPGRKVSVIFMATDTMTCNHHHSYHLKSLNRIYDKSQELTETMDENPPHLAVGTAAFPFIIPKGSRRRCVISPCACPAVTAPCSQGSEKAVSENKYLESFCKFCLEGLHWQPTFLLTFCGIFLNIFVFLTAQIKIIIEKIEIKRSVHNSQPSRQPK